MPRDLTDRQVAALTKPGFHRVARGLYIQIRPPASRAWLFRYSRNGRNVWLGLGRVDIVTMEAAKRKVLEYQRMRDDKLDPLTEKRRAKRGETFQQVAESYLAEHLPHFKNEVHKAQWQSTLTRYAFPKIGSMLCRDIQPEDIADVLRPLASTPETQKRLRGRLAKIMDSAKGRAFATAITQPLRGTVAALSVAVIETQLCHARPGFRSMTTRGLIIAAAPHR